MRFSKQQKELIEQAVKAAESKSSGEIVPVVVAASGDYRGVAIRLSWAGFFLASIAAARVHRDYPFLDFYFLLGLQVLGALLGWLIGRLPRAIRLLAGEKKTAAEVHEAALAAFTRHGLHHTRDGTGILIFLSLLERRVEILADRGIHAKVGESFWKIEAQKLVLGIREGRAAHGLESVIRDMGGKLAEHFPRAADDTNELSDELRLS
jgi:putative membrane protein